MVERVFGNVDCSGDRSQNCRTSIVGSLYHSLDFSGKAIYLEACLYSGENGMLKGAIYRWSDGVLIGETNEVQIIHGWNHLIFPTDVQIEANTEYLIAIHGSIGTSDRERVGTATRAVKQLPRTVCHTDHAQRRGGRCEDLVG